jgi:hypothetical protein
MKRKDLLTALVAMLTLNLAGVSPAWAQPTEPAAGPVQVAGVKTTFIRLGQGVPGLLYEPATPGAKAQIALFVMHSAGDYLTHSACTELSRRGYRVLCANNSNSKSGAFDDGRLDQVLLEAKRGIAFLRAYPGVKKIVLFGHSGGATIMTAYQDIAENGVKVCQDARKIHKCPDTLVGLPPADGVVLGDANYGVAEMTLFSVDPAVTDETTGVKLDPALNLFNPSNGFRPEGSSFSPAFVAKFLAAEGERNNRLTKLAEDRLALIDAGRGQYLDDEPFIVPGASLLGVNNKLFAQDVRLLSHTQKAWPLVHPDGSITTQIVHTVRVPENPQSTSPFMMRGAMKTTVRSFLSTYAIRVDKTFGYDEDSIHGVDWTSSYSSPPGNAEGISAPILTLGMTGHWEFLAAELVYDHAKSADKSIAFIEGATHLYTPCKPCEKTPGQFGDTVKTTYDYIDGWLSKPGRFL